MFKDQGQHHKVIHDFLVFLNEKSNNYILKGGTALLECYNLSRFSEDIDLDGKGDTIINIISEYCEKNSIELNFAKNTDTVKRFKLHYDKENQGVFLKIEVSYRNKHINPEYITEKNGIKTYKIDHLMTQKIGAFHERDKIRDLYDVCFIYNNYKKELHEKTKDQLAEAFYYKEQDYVDYLLETQLDELVDSEDLLDLYLKTYEDLIEGIEDPVE